MLLLLLLLLFFLLLSLLLLLGPQQTPQTIVLGPHHSRAFKHLFEKANDKIKDIFGLEIVQMPPHAKSTERLMESLATRNNANVEEKYKDGHDEEYRSGMYMVRSVLDGDTREGFLTVKAADGEWMVVVITILSLIFVNGQTLSIGMH